MRHIKTVLAAAVVGPLAWILFALGQDRSAGAFANAPDGGLPDSGAFVRPALVLAAAGILFGLIATLRVSPLGATLTGLAYSASYLGLLISPASVMSLLDHDLTLIGYEVELAAPVRTGTSLLVGSLLLVGVVSVRRWRRWPQPADEASPAVLPDEIIPPASRPDRPLGVDGLGLSTPRKTPEPEPVGAGGPGWAGRSDWTGSADRTSRSDWTGAWAGTGRSDWGRVPSGESGDTSGRSSAWTRQPSG